MKPFITNAFLVMSAIFAPAKGMILTALALVLFDLITGIWAAKKRGEAITSAGLGRSITKAFVYESAILLAFLTQQYLTGEDIPVAKIVAGLVGITELVSCLENLNTIGDNNLLKAILDKLGSVNK